MTNALYQEVFGEGQAPSLDQLKELSSAVSALPENVFVTIFLHYGYKKTPEEISVKMNQPIQLVMTWRKSGIALLKAFYGIGQSPSI